VKFADGLVPGDVSASDGETLPSPKPILPKEKRFKKKKVKRKIKVRNTDSPVKINLAIMGL